MLMKVDDLVEMEFGIDQRPTLVWVWAGGIVLMFVLCVDIKLRLQDLYV